MESMQGEYKGPLNAISTMGLLSATQDLQRYDLLVLKQETLQLALLSPAPAHPPPFRALFEHIAVS